ncbi:MAG: RNA polymerase sigma factor [Janthinobacterium lividum]
MRQPDGPAPFESVVARYGASVLRVCRAVLGPDAADDAWSETFLAALRAYPQLPTGSDVEAWLVTIAHHKSIDAWRARSRRAVPLPDVPEGSGTGAHPGDWRADVLAAVAGLPDKQRRCVAYHHLAGLPYSEIAELLGGTPEAARRAAADGIATLRRTWKETP